MIFLLPLNSSDIDKMTEQEPAHPEGTNHADDNPGSMNKDTTISQPQTHALEMNEVKADGSKKATVSLFFPIYLARPLSQAKFLVYCHFSGNVDTRYR